MSQPGTTRLPYSAVLEVGVEPTTPGFSGSALPIELLELGGAGTPITVMPGDAPCRNKAPRRSFRCGDPSENRTRVACVKDRRPTGLDDGTEKLLVRVTAPAAD
jgi:hypothetical protein